MQYFVEDSSLRITFCTARLIELTADNNCLQSSDTKKCKFENTDTHNKENIPKLSQL